MKDGGAKDGVQALERGLRILRLLSGQRRLTATAIAEELGVHQSSASRQLASLLRAGFVRKPDFHSFALDYGTLAFAGHALACFPVVPAASAECNRLQRDHPGFGATVGMYWEDRILYLTRASSDLSQKLLDDDQFPPHRSSIGLALAAERSDAEARNLLANSLRRHAAAAGRAATTAAARLLAETRATIARHGLFYARDMGVNRINAALTFATDGPRAALAFFTEAEDPAPSPGEIRALLAESVARIRAEAGFTPPPDARGSG